MELGKETREVKVHVDNLTKRFGDLLVLDQISFDVYKGAAVRGRAHRLR